ncbi:MAG: methylenetetrahydrofolate reductase [bacterium]
MKSESNLEKILTSGRFAVTAELAPPRSALKSAVEKTAGYLKDRVDAVNVSDNKSAVVRMSSIAAAKIIMDMGIEPVVQAVCRDRNRIAMQSDLLGAAALGCRNLLCLTGDHQRFGNQPEAKNVFDIDSIQMVAMVRKMRDEKKLLGGDGIDSDFPMFIGAVENPFADPFIARVQRLGKKAAAGADFIQTQCVFDLERFGKWMEGVRERGLDEKVFILAGVMPLTSAEMAEKINKNPLGFVVPDEIVGRLKDVPKEKQADEGVKICLELIARIKEIKGIKGIHLMTADCEHLAPEIIERAGLARK